MPPRPARAPPASQKVLTRAQARRVAAPPSRRADQAKARRPRVRARAKVLLSLPRAAKTVQEDGAGDAIAQEQPPLSVLQEVIPVVEQQVPLDPEQVQPLDDPHIASLNGNVDQTTEVDQETLEATPAVVAQVDAVESIPGPLPVASAQKPAPGPALGGSEEPRLSLAYCFTESVLAHRINLPPLMIRANHSELKQLRLQASEDNATEARNMHDAAVCGPFIVSQMPSPKDDGEVKEALENQMATQARRKLAGNLDSLVARLVHDQRESFTCVHMCISQNEIGAWVLQHRDVLGPGDTPVLLGIGIKRALSGVAVSQALSASMAPQAAAAAAAVAAPPLGLALAATPAEPSATTNEEALQEAPTAPPLHLAMIIQKPPTPPPPPPGDAPACATYYPTPAWPWPQTLTEHSVGDDYLSPPNGGDLPTDSPAETEAGGETVSPLEASSAVEIDMPKMHPVPVVPSTPKRSHNKRPALPLDDVRTLVLRAQRLHKLKRVDVAQRAGVVSPDAVTRWLRSNEGEASEDGAQLVAWAKSALPPHSLERWASRSSGTAAPDISPKRPVPSSVQPKVPKAPKPAVVLASAVAATAAAKTRTSNIRADLYVPKNCPARHILAHLALLLDASFLEAANAANASSPRCPARVVGTRNSFDMSPVGVAVDHDKIDWCVPKHLAPVDSLLSPHPIDASLVWLGLSTHLNVLSDAALCDLETKVLGVHADSLLGKGAAANRPATFQHTWRGGGVARTKMFFGARYLWTAKQLSESDAHVARGIRRDVADPPRFIIKDVLPALHNKGLTPLPINQVAINVYETGGEGLAPHFDDARRFSLPVVSIRLFSDSRLSFGCRGSWGVNNGAFAIPMPRGSVLVMHEGTFAALRLKHSIRTCDMRGRSGVVLFRHVHEHLLSDALDLDIGRTGDALLEVGLSEEGQVRQCLWSALGKLDGGGYSS